MFFLLINVEITKALETKKKREKNMVIVIVETLKILLWVDNRPFEIEAAYHSNIQKHFILST